MITIGILENIFEILERIEKKLFEKEEPKKKEKVWEVAYYKLDQNYRIVALVKKAIYPISFEILDEILNLNLIILGLKVEEQECKLEKAKDGFYFTSNAGVQYKIEIIETEV